MAEPTSTGAGRPNRNKIWMIGVALAAVVVAALALQSRGGDGRSGAQVYSSSSQNTPAAQASSAGGAAPGG
jgi:hypothetical protein